MMKRMRDKSEDWRVGQLFLYSPVFEQMVDKLQAITVKPGQSARSLERQIAKDLSYQAENVYLVSQNAE
jgi:hypothetical protein